MCAHSRDTTDSWLLAADHWFKINNKRLAPGGGLFFISRQLSVISRQEVLWQDDRQPDSKLYSEMAGAQFSFKLAQVGLVL